MTGKLILLVEDDRSDELLTLRALRESKLENDVVVVRDGAEALDFLFCTGAYVDRNANRMPELILLDIRLPKIGGVEVLRHIRADVRTCRLPVVILTTLSADQDWVNSHQYGPNVYIHKPVDFIQIVQALRQLGLSLYVINKDASF